LRNTLLKHYRENSSSDWKWFESLLAYDNGMLPLALLHAAEILRNDEITEIALETTGFLTEIMYSGMAIYQLSAMKNGTKRRANALFVCNSPSMHLPWC
jgi:uncharacterized protein YyaL (SSP411 family)